VPPFTHPENARMCDPSLTVLVCARNEELLLRRTLLSLTAQKQVRPFQLVVVDNASSDATPTIAREFTETVVRSQAPGKVPSLKAGLLATSGEIVAIADADTEYPPFWAALIVKAFAQCPRCQFVFGSSDLALPQFLGGPALFLSSLWVWSSLSLGVACSLGFNMAARYRALVAVLNDLPPVAFSGWAIGTAMLRTHGHSAIKYLPGLQVPKCMRRYQAKGHMATTGLWLGEWLRLVLRRPMRIDEANYYHADRS
jgi:glycosyltransferase involved in cell wall biosynthesis